MIRLWSAFTIRSGTICNLPCFMFFAKNNKSLTFPKLGKLFFSGHNWRVVENKTVLFITASFFVQFGRADIAVPPSSGSYLPEIVVIYLHCLYTILCSWICCIFSQQMTILKKFFPTQFVTAFLKQN